jgi:hypothetical protein
LCEFYNIYGSFENEEEIAMLLHHFLFLKMQPHLLIYNIRPNVWFSSFFILCGASIIAVMLTVAGNQVEESASMSMFDAIKRRENYESQMSRVNPLSVRIHAFLAYNSAYLICIFAWILWMGFIMVWSMLYVPEWDFSHAQYFAVSLCSSAGSFSLPSTSPNAAYGLAGLSMVGSLMHCPCYHFGAQTLTILFSPDDWCTIDGHGHIVRNYHVVARSSI